jgi:hypothetical protein
LYGLSKAIADHIKTHGYQGVPSPIVDRYPTPLSDDAYKKAKELILFLRRLSVTEQERDDREFELAVENAYDSIDKKPTVLDVIHQLNKK